MGDLPLYGSTNSEVDGHSENEWSTRGYTEGAHTRMEIG